MIKNEGYDAYVFRTGAFGIEIVRHHFERLSKLAKVFSKPVVTSDVLPVADVCLNDRMRLKSMVFVFQPLFVHGLG